MRMICTAKSVIQDALDDTGTPVIGFIPSIPFSEFPGPWCVAPDPDNPERPAYFLRDPNADQ